MKKLDIEKLRNPTKGTREYACILKELKITLYILQNLLRDGYRDDRNWNASVSNTAYRVNSIFKELGFEKDEGLMKDGVCVE